jgi:hypothetical protein
VETARLSGFLKVVHQKLGSFHGNLERIIAGESRKGDSLASKEVDNKSAWLGLLSP